MQRIKVHTLSSIQTIRDNFVPLSSKFRNITIEDPCFLPPAPATLTQFVKNSEVKVLEEQPISKKLRFAYTHAVSLAHIDGASQDLFRK